MEISEKLPLTSTRLMSVAPRPPTKQPPCLGCWPIAAVGWAFAKPRCPLRRHLLPGDRRRSDLPAQSSGFDQGRLINKSENFIKGSALQRSKRLLGEGLLTAEGEAHRRQRRLIQPAFHRSRIEGYAQVMTACTERSISEWHDGQTLDLAEEMMALTLAIVGKTLFDADIQAEAGEVGEAITGMLRATDTSSLSSILVDLLMKLPIVKKRSGAKAQAKFERAKARLDELIFRLIEERRRSGDRGDLLSMLILAQDEADGAMSNLQLRDGGHDDLYDRDMRLQR